MEIRQLLDAPLGVEVDPAFQPLNPEP